MIPIQALLRTQRPRTRKSKRRAIVRSASPGPYGLVASVQGIWEVYENRAIAAQTRWKDRTGRLSVDRRSDQ